MNSIQTYPIILVRKVTTNKYSIKVVLLSVLSSLSICNWLPYFSYNQFKTLKYALFALLLVITFRHIKFRRGVIVLLGVLLVSVLPGLLKSSPSAILSNIQSLALPFLFVGILSGIAFGNIIVLGFWSHG